jgi:hypothetical protein
MRGLQYKTESVKASAALRKPEINYIRVRQASLPSHIMIPPGFIPLETWHAAQHLPVSR